MNDRGRNEIKNWSRTNPSTIKHNLLENDITSRICVEKVWNFCEWRLDFCMKEIAEETLIMFVLHATDNELYKEITNDGYREHEIYVYIHC